MASSTSWRALEKAQEKDTWSLAKDQLLRKEMHKLMEKILDRAGKVGASCKSACEKVESSMIDVDMLINSFERISTVQFVENVSVQRSFFPLVSSPFQASSLPSFTHRRLLLFCFSFLFASFSKILVQSR